MSVVVLLSAGNGVVQLLKKMREEDGKCFSITIRSKQLPNNQDELRIMATGCVTRRINWTAEGKKLEIKPQSDGAHDLGRLTSSELQHLPPSLRELRVQVSVEGLATLLQRTQQLPQLGHLGEQNRSCI